MQSAGKQGFLKHSLEGEILAWVLLEASAKWSGPEQNQPPRTQAGPMCWKGLGEDTQEERWDRKDRSSSFHNGFRPLEYGKETLSPTHQTKGKERPRWARNWRGWHCRSSDSIFLIQCCLHKICSSQAMSGLPASGWIGKAPTGPQRNKPRYMFPWDEDTQTSKHETPGSPHLPPVILPRPLLGEHDTSLMPLTHQVTHGDKTLGAPPHGPLGCAELIHGPLACRALFPQHSSDRATPTQKLINDSPWPKAMVPKGGYRKKNDKTFYLYSAFSPHPSLFLMIRV